MTGLADWFSRCWWILTFHSSVRVTTLPTPEVSHTTHAGPAKPCSIFKSPSRPPPLLTVINPLGHFAEFLDFTEFLWDHIKNLAKNKKSWRGFRTLYTGLIFLCVYICVIFLCFKNYTYTISKIWHFLSFWFVNASVSGEPLNTLEEEHAIQTDLFVYTRFFSRNIFQVIAKNQVSKHTYTFLV